MRAPRGLWPDGDLATVLGGGQQGQQNLAVTLAGQFTNWVQGTTVANFGSGVTIASLTVNSSTAATAVVNIDLVVHNVGREQEIA